MGNSLSIALRGGLLFASMAASGLLLAQALDPATRDALRARIERWEALTPASRDEARQQMQAWLRLPQAQQSALRDSAAAFVALPAQEQATLRARFEALSGEERRGWRLGPALGPYYPRLHPLIAYVPEAQREPLLQTLQAMPPQELELLGRLAFSTPPARRDALRQALIRQPVPDRLRWLMTELDR